MANQVYDIVLEKITKALDKGIIPWKKPWKGTDGEHVNIITKIPYHGVNVLLLNIATAVNNYKYPLWITWKQAAKKKWSIKKGAKTTVVSFFKKYEAKTVVEDDDRTTKARDSFVLRYYRVFNIQDVEDYEDKLGDYKISKVSDRDEELKKQTSMFYSYMDAEGIPLTFNAQRSYYSAAADAINLPKQESFVSQPAFYQTLAHEIVHSTGHPKRNSRFSDSYNGGIEEYSKEELVAEIGSAFLCSEMGIEVNYENTAAYLAGWATYLRDARKTELFSAAKAAERAMEFIKKQAVIGAIRNAVTPVKEN